MSERAEASPTNFWGDADDEEALQRYRTLVNAIDDGIYQLDSDGQFVAVNDVIVELSGYSREELLGEHVSVLLDDEDVVVIETEIRRRLRERDPPDATFEFEVQTADGEAIPCELRLNLLVEDGTFRGSIGVVRDVSEQKRTKRELSERERELERERDLTEELLEASPMGTMVLDDEGEVVRINDRARELLDVPEGDLQRYSPGDRPTYDEDGQPIPVSDHPFAEVLATGEPVYDRLLQVERPDGERLWLSVSAAPVTTDDGDIDRVITTGEDVTDLKERERELEDELSEVFGRVTDAFYALDTDWRFTHANDRAEELIDYRGEGLVGEDFWEVFEWAEGSTLGEEYREAMDSQEPTSFEFYYPEPLESWYEVHAYPSETGLSVYFRDVTERKARERALEESEHRYRTLVENFPNGAVALVDENLHYRTVGGDPIIDDVTAAELEGEPVGGVLPPGLADQFVPRYEAALDGESSTFEATVEGRIYQVHVLPVRDDDGEIFAALGMSQDVTERKERERELEEHRSRYETLVENFPNGAVALVDEDLRYVTFGGTPEVEGVTRADLEGSYLREEIPEELAEVVVPHYEAALDGESAAVEATIDGGVYQFHFLPVRDDDGEVFAALGMSQNVTEREEYQRKLEESERRYRALAEYFPNGIVTLFDHDLRYTLAAGKGFEDIPVEPEEVEGRSFRDVWGEETADALEPVFEAALDGEQRSVELEYVGREWVVHGVPITDERGDVFAGMTMAQDITEQKERERYLREAKSQLEAATEAGAVGTWEWNIPEDEFVTGASFARTFGVDPEDARESVSIDRVVSSIHEDDRERVEREIEAAMESCGEYEEEYRVWSADGELRWVVARGHVECDEDGNPINFPGALTDITERKRAEKRLEEHRRQLETLFEVLPVGVMVADGNGDIIEANEAAKDIWGVEEFGAETVDEYGRYRAWWADSGGRVDPEEWTLARVLRDEEVTDPDIYEIETADGEHRTIMAHGMPIRNADGEVTRAVATLTDVTERREYQQQLERQNERLESFASMLAHELRNPVTIGQIYTQQLPDERAPEAVEYVTEAFDRIEDMIDVMLVLTRGREAVGESSPLELADVAREAWDGVDAPDATLDVDLDRVVEADETYVRHLFRNLFENSVEHGSADRSVTVTVGNLPTGFYVADDGVGIPAEDREDVFEAGFTTAADSGGTGLGLAFVRELAEVYGWEYEAVESETGGARFEFRNVEFAGDS